MPRFTVVPINATLTSTEIIAPDAGNVLNLVSRLKYQDADVLQDGRYAFSVHLNDGGMWSIFQRENAQGAADTPKLA